MSMALAPPVSLRGPERQRGRGERVGFGVLTQFSITQRLTHRESLKESESESFTLTLTVRRASDSDSDSDSHSLSPTPLIHGSDAHSLRPTPFDSDSDPDSLCPKSRDSESESESPPKWRDSYSLVGGFVSGFWLNCWGGGPLCL